MRLLCKLVEKDAIFSFDEACIEAFNKIKKRLIFSPIMLALNLSLPFEIMCDMSDYAIGAMLGQHHDKIL